MSVLQGARRDNLPPVPGCEDGVVSNVPGSKTVRLRLLRREREAELPHGGLVWKLLEREAPLLHLRGGRYGLGHGVGDLLVVRGEWWELPDGLGNLSRVRR